MNATAGPPTAGRQLPTVEPPAIAFWAGARRGELVVQRCADCQFWIHPPRWVCPRCQSETLGAAPVSGNGTVYAFSIMNMRGVPGFDPPYGVAVIELAEQEGLIMFGQILDLDADQYRVGLPVHVAFEELTAEVTLPQWRVS